MAATTSPLAPAVLSVEPGGEVTCELRLRNGGGVVDQFSFETLGNAAHWAQVEPAVLPLFPGAEGTVVVRFRPPRVATVLAGIYPFAIKVSSAEDAGATVVEEGTLEVVAFSEISAELIPRTARGRSSAHFELAFDNRSNTGVNATLAAADPDNQLRFRFAPPALTAGPGTASFTKLKVTPRRKFLGGKPKTHPFQVTTSSPGAEPQTVEGTMLHEALIPRWVPALLLLAAVLVVAWFLLLRPTIKSLAQDAVSDPLAQQKAAVDAVAANQAKDHGALADVASKLGLPTPSPLATVAPQVSHTPGFDSQLGDPFNSRLAATAAKSAGGDDNFAPSAGQTLTVTDVIFENPQSDSGVLTVQRVQGDGKTTTVFQVRLDNFRDLDYHFVTPVVITSGNTLRLHVDCAAPGSGAPQCAPAMYYAGHLHAGPSPTP